LENNIKNNDLPIISAFPKGKEFWRIDWFGEVAFPDRTVRRTQPSVLVHLSRLKDDGFLSDSAKLLAPESTAPAKFQKHVWVSIGTLILLRVGDIWQNGRLVAEPDYQLTTFEGLSISIEATKLIKAGFDLDGQAFLLPLDEHPWHLQCTQSYCLLVDLPDAKRLIIPCMELIRFYFGSSSSLITKLFLPPLVRDTLYRKASFKYGQGKLSLELAQGISGRSASDIGRLHLDPMAWNSAVLIGVSMLKASVSGQQIYPYSFFPFEGTTTLIAAGKWLSLNGESDKTFLVYNLRSCSHPFPFNGLRYETSASEGSSSSSHSSSDAADGSQSHKRARDDRDQQLVDRDPSGRLKSRTKFIYQKVRFPDLIGKPVWREKAIGSDGELKQTGLGDSIGEAAVGVSGADNRIRPIDLAVALAANLSPPEFLRPLLEKLRGLKDATIKLLTASDKDGWTIPVPLIADRDGVIDPRLLFKLGEVDQRLRQVAIFVVHVDSQILHFAAIEGYEWSSCLASSDLVFDHRQILINILPLLQDTYNNQLTSNLQRPRGCK
jgi:hypothetical protein